MGNYLILKKLLEGKLFLFCFPKRTTENNMKWHEMENGETRKCDNETTVEPYTGWTNQRGKDAISAGPTKQKDAISDDHTW